MSSHSNRPFLVALVRSAHTDSAGPGAKARALVRMQEESRRVQCAPLRRTGALIVAFITLTAMHSSRGVVVEGAGTPACAASIEGPSDGCDDVRRVPAARASGEAVTDSSGADSSTWSSSS